MTTSNASDKFSDELPAELREFWSLLRDGGPEAADNDLHFAIGSRQKREAREAATATNIAETWAEGWRYFDAVIWAMEQHAHHLLARAEVEDGYEEVREALTLLHAAATMTLHEIWTMCRAGFIAGGVARWRALHELSVTATLVAKGGPPIAQRYLDHGYVVRVRRLEAFYAQPHPKAPSPSIRKERLEQADGFVARHTLAEQSSPFGGPYGWAVPLMGRRKDGKFLEPSFDRLEKIAHLEGSRILMSSAHGHVHTDSGGVRAAVLPDDSVLLLGSTEDHAQTVIRPTLQSVIHFVAPTYLGFEHELSEISRLLGHLASGVCENARRGIAAFHTPDPTSVRLF